MPNMEMLVEQYGKVIYGLCRKLTACRFDADDLYQQTFLIAMSKEFRDDGNPKALLTRICIGQWRNDVRKKGRRQRLAPVTELEPESIPISAHPEEQLEKRQQLDALRRIVAELDDRFRLPVLLYYGLDLSVNEVAAALHCPAGTVKSRLSAARAKIKKELEVTGYDG